MTFAWTVESIAAARRLYVDEGFSASETARRIGTTRAAVIGKAHREGWADERRPELRATNTTRVGKTFGGTRQGGGRPVNYRIGAQPRSLKPQAPPQPLEVPPTARLWTEREAGQCAFPVSGQGDSMMACCAPAGLADYCPLHMAMAYARRSEAQTKALDRIAEYVDRLEGVVVA